MASHRVFQTNDLDQARIEGERLLAPHRLTHTHQERTVDSEIRSYQLSDDVMLFYCRYGGYIYLQAPDLPFTLLQTPIAGTAQMEIAGETVVQNERLGSIVTAGSHLRFRFQPDTERLAIALRPSAIQQALSVLLGQHPSRSVQFELLSPVDDPRTQGLHDLIRMIAQQVDIQSPVLPFPLARAQLIDHLWAQLLYGHRHNYSELLLRACTAPAPYHVRRVEEYIDAHADQPIRLAHLVAVAGVSARALQVGFRTFRNTTPMSYLNHVRLSRARDDLLAADPLQTTVTEIANHWGFFALGRFSQRYRRTFGESPSQTLRVAFARACSIV